MIVWLLGWLWWLLVPIRRARAIANFRRCFPELPAGPNLRRSVGEMAIQFPRLALGARCTIEGVEQIQSGGLCLAGHFGPWEILLVSLADIVPVTIFIKEPSNPTAARIIQRLRMQARHLELLTANDNPRQMYRALRAGRLVLMVQDQRFNGGMETPFFGAPCLTSIAFAALAHHQRPPLLGVHQWYEGGQICARIEGLDWTIPETRADAIRHLTEQSQRFYEEKIRLRPHSWLWLHDRWRIDRQDLAPKK